MFYSINYFTTEAEAKTFSVFFSLPILLFKFNVLLLLCTNYNNLKMLYMYIAFLSLSFLMCKMVIIIIITTVINSQGFCELLEEITDNIDSWYLKMLVPFFLKNISVI